MANETRYYRRTEVNNLSIKRHRCLFPHPFDDDICHYRIPVAKPSDGGETSSNFHADSTNLNERQVIFEPWIQTLVTKIRAASEPTTFQHAAHGYPRGFETSGAQPGRPMDVLVDQVIVDRVVDTSGVAQQEERSKVVVRRWTREVADADENRALDVVLL